MRVRDFALCLPLILGCDGRGRGADAQTVDPGECPSGPGDLLTVRQVVGWVLGADTRAKRSRGAGSAGLLRVPKGATSLAAGTAMPRTCTPTIQGILVDRLTGEIFGVDDDGRINMLVGGKWQQLPSAAGVEAPALENLLAFESATSPLHMLVEEKGGRRLWELTIGGGKIIDVDQRSIDEALFRSQALFLQHYDTGRCISGPQNCLFISVMTDGDAFLDQEPTPGAAREEVLVLGETGTRDAVYSGPGNAELLLLTELACR